MMSDAIDDALDDDEAEDETEELTNQVGFYKAIIFSHSVWKFFFLVSVWCFVANSLFNYQGAATFTY